MTYQFQLSRNRCIIFAFAVAALNILSAFSLSAQKTTKARARTQATNWVITIDVSSGDPTPVYDISPKPTSVNYPCTFSAGDQANGPKVLRVCPDDTVVWQAKTSGTPSTMRSQMIVLFEDAIIDNKNGDPVQTFHAQDGMQDGGAIDSSASSDVAYEYSVFVSDKLTKQVFIDDPKIIIGTGTAYDVLNNAETNCEKLRDRLRGNPVAEAQVARLCEQIQKAKNLLNSQ